jgi:energy-coupling factor transporter ATP-binding protein EcfA2
MIVKDLIKHLKKMPQTKQVLFFNHDTEILLNLDEGAWNVSNTKWVEDGKKGTYINHVEIAGKYTGERHNLWVENKQQNKKISE